MMVYQLPFPLFLPKGLGFSLGFSTRHGLMMGCHPLAIAVDGPPEGRAGFFRGPRRREVRPHGDPSVDDAAGATAAEVSRAKEGSISFLWTYGFSMTFPTGFGISRNRCNYIYSNYDYNNSNTIIITIITIAIIIMKYSII